MKRLISMAIICLILIFPVAISAETNGPLSYERSAALFNINNNTVKKLHRAEGDAYRQYKLNKEQADCMDVNGFTFKMGDKETYVPYDVDTKLMLTKVKELYPEQMKFSWEAAKYNRIVTTNSLNASLRGVFFGVYSAQSDLQLKQKQFSLATDINQQDKLKLKNGMITELNLEESNYNLQNAKKDVDVAKRNYDNAVRNLNQFTGLPSNNQFTSITYSDNLKHPKWESVDYYIDTALENRFDIISIKSQIALKQQEKKIIETGYSYRVTTTKQEEHERLLNDLEQLNTDLEGMRLSINDEIKNAYVDVIKTGKGVDTLYNTLKLQRSSYAKMQEKYKAGLISKNVLTQAELGLQQVENGYKAALYDYNTRIMRFNNATGIGPGY